MQVLECACALRVTLDCETVYQFICAMDTAQAWPLAEELFYRACLSLGVSALCPADEEHPANMTPELRDLYSRVRTCCECGKFAAGSGQQSGKCADLGACCSAMLAAYTHAAPPQPQRVLQLLAAMAGCAPTCTCTSATGGFRSRVEAGCAHADLTARSSPLMQHRTRPSQTRMCRAMWHAVQSSLNSAAGASGATQPRARGRFVRRCKCASCQVPVKCTSVVYGLYHVPAHDGFAQRAAALSRATHRCCPYASMRRTRRRVQCTACSEYRAGGRAQLGAAAVRCVSIHAPRRLARRLRCADACTPHAVRGNSKHCGS